MVYAYYRFYGCGCGLIRTEKARDQENFLHSSVKLLECNIDNIDIIRLDLRQARYKRYVAFRKPLVLEKNRQLHLEFALEHIN